MNRSTRFAPRIQGQTRQLVTRNPTMQTDGGRSLAVGLHENMDMRRREVEEARHKMQMKYKEEAEEAARKKKEKEQKKREAWLARQEALVRPGHVLGRGGPSEKNLLRDYMEHEFGDEYQQHMGQTEQHSMDQQYNALVQQRIERQRESAQLQRRQEQSKGVTPTRPGDIARHGAVSRSGPPNQTSEYFLGSGYSASPARSNGKGYVAQAHTVSPGCATGSSSTALHSNSHGLPNQAAGANLAHVLGTGNATSPKSDNYCPPNQTSEYFLGSGYSASPARSNGKGYVAQAHTVSPGCATGSSSTALHSNSHGLPNQAAGANLAHVLGTGNATSPKSDNYLPDVQPNHREEMLAARRRFQDQYNARLKEVAKAKEDGAQDTAERRDSSSSN